MSYLNVLENVLFLNTICIPVDSELLNACVDTSVTMVVASVIPSVLDWVLSNNIIR